MSSEERYPVQYDDLFVYAPSFALYESMHAEGDEQGLTEGKYVGAAKEVDLVFMNKDKTMDSFLRPEEFARERKVGVTVGRRRLKEVQAQAYTDLYAAIRRGDRGSYDHAELKREATRVMKRAWRDAFLAGVRSTGIRGRGQGMSGVALEPDDEAWLKSAMTHEMRFLNAFVQAVVDESWKMPLDKRTHMYVRALESFYDSARVIGLPATSVIRWTGKKDKRVCASCEYLHQHNPYHKKNLPTVPRSGMTICLTNCRDRLLVRVTDTQTALEVLRDSAYTRAGHVRNLLEIKRLGKLPARLAK